MQKVVEKVGSNVRTDWGTTNTTSINMATTGSAAAIEYTAYTSYLRTRGPGGEKMSESFMLF